MMISLDIEKAFDTTVQHGIDGQQKCSVCNIQYLVLTSDGE